MIWPAMLFNLCVGLLFAAYLLRGVRRFERRVDSIIARMDAADAASQARYDAARDEMRASLRAQVDRAVAEMQARVAELNAMVAEAAAGRPGRQPGRNGPAASPDPSEAAPAGP
jgi:RNA processing factor Prp31